MIMILSDGGSAVQRMQNQLEIRDESYFLYFTAFAAAGRFGKGTVTVGDGSEKSVYCVLKKNRGDAVIDVIGEAAAEASENAMVACKKLGIPYVKYMNLEENYNGKVCLSHRQLADMLRRCRGNILMYAAPGTVNAVAERLPDGGERLFVPVLKGAGFDSDAALEYSVPIRNVIETDAVDGKEYVLSLIDKYDVKAVVCDTTTSVSDKSDAADIRDIQLIVTHNMGMEYSASAATAADAVIAIRTMRDAIALEKDFDNR